MKPHTLITLLAITLSAVCAAAEPTHMRVNEIVRSNTPKGWQFETDKRMFVISLSKVRLLNPVSLPAGDTDDEIWEEFSWEADFIILIRVTSKIDAVEYAALTKLRADTISRRIHEWEEKHGEPINGKSRWGLVQEVHSTLQLPYCHSESDSIWITSTDYELLRTRPKAARDVADAIRAGLAGEFTLYNENSESDLRK